MTEVAKTFLTQFHNVPGTTVKQKHDNFFQLLYQYRLLFKREDLAVVEAYLQPTDHLENIFHIDFLIYFKRFGQLYQELKKGNEIAVCKLSKHVWFYETAFKEVTCEEFINTILPSSSYSLKLKILKKIPINETQADEFFDAICKRYGIFFATVLLPKCSSSKICETLTTYPIRLSVAQMKVIFDKDPNLICVYLEERVKHVGDSSFMNYSPIFVYIAQKNPELFSNLYNKYDFNVRLGRRTTKNLILGQKLVISNDIPKFLKVLKSSTAVRKMGSEVYAKTQSDYLLRFYPKKQRFDVYKSVHVAELSGHILRYITDSQQRHRIAIQKMENEHDIDYLKYVTPDYCLTEVMEKIHHTTSRGRARYVESATHCCLLNEDLSSFLKICELVSVRFRNDDKAIRKVFLDSLIVYKNIMQNLDERHWKFILEIIATTKAKFEHYKEVIHLSNYLKYLLNNNKSLEELLHTQFPWFYVLNYLNQQQDKKTIKTLLLLLSEVGYCDPEQEIKTALFDCALAHYCKLYSNDAIPISTNPRFLKSLKTVLEHPDDLRLYATHYSGINYMVRQLSSSEQVKESKKMFLKSFNTFGQESTIKWLLQHDPNTVVDNLDYFLTIVMNSKKLNTKKFWQFLKKYSHLGLVARIIDFCKMKYEGRTSSIKALAILSPPSSYLEYVGQCLSVSGRGNKKNYLLQNRIVRFLHYVESPEVLELTLQFCRGKYLRYALSPLYSCMCKLPEVETKDFIRRLDQNKALKLKKHALNLTCVVCDSQTVYTSLKSTIVPSLLPTLKYFVKNPSDTLWDLVKTQIGSLKKQELSILKVILHIQVPYRSKNRFIIPFQYKSRFIEVIWTVLDKHQAEELKTDFLRKIRNDSGANFDSDFVSNFIRNNLFKCEDATFVVKILIFWNSKEKFNLLSKILSVFKKKYWHDSRVQRSARQKVNSFVACLFKEYMTMEETDQKFVSDLSEVFGSVFSFSEAFEEIVIIKCMALKGENIENSSKLLIELNGVFSEAYGTAVVDVLAETLHRYVFTYVLSQDDDKIQLCQSLFKLRHSVNDCLLILKLLPKKVPEEGKYFVLYDAITSRIRKVKDGEVQWHYNLFSKSCQNVDVELDWAM